MSQVILMVLTGTACYLAGRTVYSAVFLRQVTPWRSVRHFLLGLYTWTFTGVGAVAMTFFFVAWFGNRPLNFWWTARRTFTSSR